MASKVKQNIIPVDKTPESYISRVVNVLECLSQGTNSLTAIAKQCKISASSTHKILSTLVGPNLVIYDPSTIGII